MAAAEQAVEHARTTNDPDLGGRLNTLSIQKSTWIERFGGPRDRYPDSVAFAEQVQAGVEPGACTQSRQDSRRGAGGGFHCPPCYATQEPALHAGAGQIRVRRLRLDDRAVLLRCSLRCPQRGGRNGVARGDAIALLTAGFSRVVAASWQLNDLAACLLSTHYHLCRRELPEVPAAFTLRATQRWLRDTPNRELADWADHLGVTYPSAAAARALAFVLRTHVPDAFFSHPARWAALALTGT